MASVCSARSREIWCIESARSGHSWAHDLVLLDDGHVARLATEHGWVEVRVSGLSGMERNLHRRGYRNLELVTGLLGAAEVLRLHSPPRILVRACVPSPSRPTVHTGVARFRRRFQAGGELTYHRFVLGDDLLRRVVDAHGDAAQHTGRTYSAGSNPTSRGALPLSSVALSTRSDSCRSSTASPDVETAAGSACWATQRREKNVLAGLRNT
jgi:hypothetical protein